MVNMLQEHQSIIDHDHEYISPTWSASVAMGVYTVTAIVTPYYENGNIFDYVRLHPGKDRMEIAYQAANAFAYIHSNDAVHGNICPVSRSSIARPSSGVQPSFLNADLLGKHLHCGRRHCASDRHSGEHHSSPDKQQSQSIHPFKLDV